MMAARSFSAWSKFRPAKVIRNIPRPHFLGVAESVYLLAVDTERVAAARQFVETNEARRDRVIPKYPIQVVLPLQLRVTFLCPEVPAEGEQQSHSVSSSCECKSEGCRTFANRRS